LKSRLIDNSLQTNHLQLDLLRKEFTDRTAQVAVEPNPEVKKIYMERLNQLGDVITQTLNRDNDLEREKREIGNLK
jgi:hypothetical protein